MRCLHPQTDNPRQFSADHRIVFEDPARNAHELRINLSRWADAFYARFCVGPGLDQAHPCTASAPGPLALDNIDDYSLSLAESADGRSFKRGDMDEHNLPPLSRTMKPYRKYKNYFLRRQCFPKQTNCRT